MRVFFSVLGVLIAVVLAAAAAVVYLTTTLKVTAGQVLGAVASGNFAGVRDRFSDDFNARTADREFELFLSRAGIVDFDQADWRVHGLSFDAVDLAGVVDSVAGEPVRLRVEFVRDGASFSIDAVRRPYVGIGSESGGIRIPDIPAAAGLARETTRAFAEAVKAGDFARFHGEAAAPLREAYSLKEFTRLFSPFLEQPVDLTVLDRTQPRFTADPALLANGMLHLQGYFPSRPSRALFSYQYAYTAAGWRLTGIDFKLRPVQSPGGG